MIHSLLLRERLLAHKLAGRLPGAPWKQVATLLPKTTNAWPRDLFAYPLQQLGGIGGDLFQTPFGSLWAPESERTSLGLTVLEMMGNIYEHGAVRIRPGDVVLDLGANLGIFTKIALNRGASKVVCFEANPAMIDCLKKSFSREIATGGVIVVEAPVWSEESMVRFSGESLTGKISENGPEVRAVTVDATVSRLALDRVDFIKADIEGAERHALRGAEQTLRRFAPRLALCVYHLPDDPEAIEAAVQKARPYQTRLHESGDFLYGW